MKAVGSRDSAEALVLFLAFDPSYSMVLFSAWDSCVSWLLCHRPPQPLLCFSEPLHQRQVMAAGKESTAPVFPGFSVVLRGWALALDG